MSPENQLLANWIIIGLILFIRYLLFEVSSIKQYYHLPNFTSEDYENRNIKITARPL